MARYAAELAGAEPLPRRSSIEISRRLNALLDHAFLVDVIENGSDYYFKYFGDIMPVMCGINLCGLRLSEVDDAGMRRSFKETYDRVVAARAPLYMRGHYVWPRAAVPIERLLIPFTDDDGVVSAICGLAVPGIADEDIARAAGEGPATLVGTDEVLSPR